MDAQNRRAAIARILEQSSAPVSATALAKEFGVSRQIIVGDIALLRASGADITATPRGYTLPRTAEGIRRTLACRHDGAQMEDELNAMVDHGCAVLDVVVEHPVYGQLSGRLDVSSRYDVREFAGQVAASGSKPLSDLTGGIHTHTLRCPDERAFAQLLEALREAGFLVE